PPCRSRTSRCRPSVLKAERPTESASPTAPAPAGNSRSTGPGKLGCCSDRPLPTGKSCSLTRCRMKSNHSTDRRSAAVQLRYAAPSFLEPAIEKAVGGCPYHRRKLVIAGYEDRRELFRRFV